MRKRVPQLFALALLLTLAIWPAQASTGARQGLEVCAKLIIPSLYPFLVGSAMLTRLVHWGTATPFFLGLAGGYPAGAAAVADAVERRELDIAQGNRMLGYCNNTGPAFIIGATGVGVFHSPKVGALLYISHVLTALVIASAVRKKGNAVLSERVPAEASLSKLLPESLGRATSATLNICGSVVFFSTLRSLLDGWGIFSATAGALARTFGWELTFCRALLTGVLELGSGISAMYGLAATPSNLALASFLLGFGGLSVHCQTLAAVSDARLRLRWHFPGKVVHGLLSAGVTFLLAMASRGMAAAPFYLVGW